MRDLFRPALLLACAAIAAPLHALDMPPLELIDANLRETPYTAHVRIDSVERAAHGDTRSGYVTFHVCATVAETFKGESRARVDYVETHEAPSAGPRVGADIVVSLTRLGDGRFAVPDNGYVFPATPAVLERARRAAAALAHGRDASH